MTTRPHVTIGEPAQEALHAEEAEPTLPTLIPDAKGHVTVTDKRGRVLKVKRVSAADRWDIDIILGDRGTLRVLGPAVMAYSVVEFDGEVVFPPKNFTQLRNIIVRLDDDGINAVAEAYTKAGWVSEPDIDPDRLKN